MSLPNGVTPGPWEVQDSPFRGPRRPEYEIIAPSPDPTRYAVLMASYTPHDDPDTWFDGKANMVFASASHELYEALELLVLTTSTYAQKPSTELIDKCNAALAKARGENTAGIPSVPSATAEGSQTLGAGTPVCDSCGKPASHINEPDPYDSEINGDETPVNLCDDCYYSHLMDI